MSKRKTCLLLSDGRRGNLWHPGWSQTSFEAWRKKENEKPLLGEEQQRILGKDPLLKPSWGLLFLMRGRKLAPKTKQKYNKEFDSQDWRKGTTTNNANKELGLHLRRQLCRDTWTALSSPQAMHHNSTDLPVGASRWCEETRHLWFRWAVTDESWGGRGDMEENLQDPGPHP